MKVVVIGAGVAGLGIGWKLARAGVSVTVLERAQAGSGATTASAGMIAAAAELGHAETPEAAFAQRANALWPAFVQELEAQSGVSVGYKKNGSLMVALKHERRGHAHSSEHPTASGGQPNPHAQGGNISLLDGAQARAMEPMLTEEVEGALWAPNEAIVDTHALIRALATAFLRAGGKLSPNETVVRIEVEDGRAVGVRTPFAVHRADAYVLAAGAWTSGILLAGGPFASGTDPLPPVIPIKGEIVVLSPPAGAVLPKHVVWGNEIYVVPRNNRLLVGATVERAGFDTSQSPEAYRWLRRHAARLMPELEMWDDAEHWAGLRPASPDGLPILGQTMVEGLFVASGQYRNGILFAPAVAEVLSRLILERETGVPAFDPRRFAGSKPHTPDSVIETPHRAPGSDSGVQEWHIGF